MPTRIAYRLAMCERETAYERARSFRPAWWEGAAVELVRLQSAKVREEVCEGVALKVTNLPLLQGKE
jgi:hypothetical protein